jgi:hypothetical protein
MCPMQTIIYMCPHTTVYVSSYYYIYYICALILLVY